MNKIGRDSNKSIDEFIEESLGEIIEEYMIISLRNPLMKSLRNPLMNSIEESPDKFMRNPLHYPLNFQP